MTQLLENTYSAFDQFLEGELNEYDLMSLVEEGIISGEVLESMLVESGLVDVEEDEEELEEGFLSSLAIAHALNNKTPATDYQHQALMKHQPNPIVKQISGNNHTQNIQKELAKRSLSIGIPERVTAAKQNLRKHFDDKFDSMHDNKYVKKAYDHSSIISKPGESDFNDHINNYHRGYVSKIVNLQKGIDKQASRMGNGITDKGSTNLMSRLRYNHLNKKADEINKQGIKIAKGYVYGD